MLKLSFSIEIWLNSVLDCLQLFENSLKYDVADMLIIIVVWMAD